MRNLRVDYQCPMLSVHPAYRLNREWLMLFGWTMLLPIRGSHYSLPSLLKHPRRKLHLQEQQAPSSDRYWD